MAGNVVCGQYQQALLGQLLKFGAAAEPDQEHVVVNSLINQVVLVHMQEKQLQLQLTILLEYVQQVLLVVLLVAAALKDFLAMYKMSQVLTEAILLICAHVAALHLAAVVLF
jgi:hypothetical protein